MSCQCHRCAPYRLTPESIPIPEAWKKALAGPPSPELADFMGHVTGKPAKDKPEPQADGAGE